MYVIYVALIAAFFLTILGMTFRIGWISGILSVALGVITYIFMRITGVMVSHLIFQAANVSCHRGEIMNNLAKCLQDPFPSLYVHN